MQARRPHRFGWTDLGQRRSTPVSGAWTSVCWMWRIRSVMWNIEEKEPVGCGPFWSEHHAGDLLFVKRIIPFSDVSPP